MRSRFFLLLVLVCEVAFGDYTSGTATSFHDNWFSDDQYVDSYITVVGPTFVRTSSDPDGYNNTHTASLFYGAGAVATIYGRARGGENPGVWINCALFDDHGAIVSQNSSGRFSGDWASRGSALLESGYCRLLGTHYVNDGSGGSFRSSYELYPDVTPPLFGTAVDFQTSNGSTWDEIVANGQTKTTVFRFRFAPGSAFPSDSKSGVGRIEYEWIVNGLSKGKKAMAANSNWIPATLSEGLNTLRITVTDNVANHTERDFTFTVDSTPPSAITPTVNLDTPLPGDPIFSLTVRWSPATDPGNGSGVSRYQLYQQLGGGWSQLGQDILVGDPLEVKVPLTRSTIGVTTGFRVVAIDAANNAIPIASATSATATVPPLLDPRLESQISGNDYLVKLNLGIPEASRLTYFDRIRIVRSTTPATPLSDWIDPATSIVVDGNLVFVDTISTSLGIGHKPISYQVFARPKGQTFEEAFPADSITLENNIGTISGLVFSNTEGVPFPNQDSFSVGSDGALTLGFRGIDPDLDVWTFEVDKVKLAGSSGEIAGYVSVSGIKKISYTPIGLAYPNAVVPITLRPGINNLCVSWQEGASQVTYRSQIVALDLVPDSSGGFSIIVTDQYRQAADGTEGKIVVRPGQPMSFEVSGTPDGTLEWYFGEQDPVFGRKVTHAFGQLAGQTGASYETSLVLKLTRVEPVTSALTTSTIATLAVTVEDTRQGELYQDEIWTGEHSVIGQVTVPSGRALTIRAGTPVQFTRGLSSAGNLGLVIQGALATETGVKLGRPQDQTELWSGVLVDGGTASLTDTEISGAERAVVAANSARVSVLSSRLLNNEIGVHVLDTSLVKVSGVSIVGSSAFGIKEDGGGRPEMVGNDFANNRMNYYQWDEGELSFVELNELTGRGATTKNSGNRGE